MSRAVAAMALAALATACGVAEPPRTGATPIDPAGATSDAGAVPAVGTWRVSAFGAAGASETLRHESTWIRGVGGYEGCDANDLRGYLDGTFKWGWNQASQVHVRVGRREGGARYGEYELFRVALRFADVVLPGDATVESARLTLTVEAGPERPVRMLLYEIRGDWLPGGGGVAGDNVSPPRPGEVWWRERAHGSAPWGLPGAGYAADGDPEADTPATALAVAAWSPGDGYLVFEGPALAESVRRRATAGMPVGFLLKLDDWSEDTPGTAMEVFSPRHGVAGAPGHRPRLDVVWSAGGRRLLERDVILEYGRRLAAGDLPTGGATLLVADFEPGAPDSLDPTLLADGAGSGVLPDHPFAPPQGVASVRPVLVAGRRPVVLGTPFVGEIRDTWIRSAPPEDQRVTWVFVAPSGRVHETDADYVGEWTWRVTFRPDEPGPWRYRYGQRFVEDRPYDSRPATFDAVAADPEAMLPLIEAFVVRVAALDDAERRRDLESLRRTFARLERAAVAGHTPASFRGDPGAALREALNRARELLGGRAPGEIPLEPSPPPDWAEDGDGES